MKEKIKAVCFTGHRKLTNIEILEINLKETIKKFINAACGRTFSGSIL